ncbi:hypothetical protein E5676_scaffold14G00590 [Cucumis melo var. makuwa]|uniref:Uncharacterized protein n=1 Tax=Cucumis melo var. makuwa TaxID=1194695 RepID=A0A5D3DSF9_CUCMM|nr:hypothetical protein E6C27_scaffold38G00950 [Cucumis melo var. makuwa]TYK26285.1 hypothetical protein E5676_scaffold14G00590 [Cucumis melo var. makuwa]
MTTSGTLQETGVLSTHKNIEESKKIVGEGYVDVFCGVGPYVRKIESGEAFSTHEQHGVGNASPDDVDGVGNTYPDAIFGDQTTGIGNTSPDVFFANSIL